MRLTTFTRVRGRPLRWPAVRPLAVWLAAWLLVAGCWLPVGEASASAYSPAALPRPAARFVLPLPPPPAVLTPFRPPANRYGRGHRGVDLGTAIGALVRAAGAGRVVFAGVLADRGVVSIEHAGGLRTTYEPVRPTVSAGAGVVAGQRIGLVEAGHPTCAPRVCLHWGARLPGGSYLDPMMLVTGLRVRLKPWDGLSGP